MEIKEWLSFPGILAFSPEEGLYVSNDVAGISTLIVMVDGLRISKFPDEETLYLSIDDVIEWHLNESTYAEDASRNQERLWYSIAATEFKRLKRDFEKEVPKEIIPNRLFSDEYMRQACAKAEREDNKAIARKFKKARPDLFSKDTSSKPPTQRSRKNRRKKDVYFAQGCVTKRIKIGISHNIQNRLTQIVSSEPLELLGMIKGGGRGMEKELHKQFESLCVHKEWFKPGEELLEYIENHVDSETASE